jgi:LytS/YehU family sensor histidine kinase
LIILCGTGLIGFLIILNNRQIRIKEKQKQDHLRLESLRGQMNPHFIFNSLNSINYFISKSDRLSANRYIADFSKLIRAILNHMSCEYITLGDELAAIHDYLKLEYLRFGDKFEYKVNTDEIQDFDKWEVFPGLVQPFIENAIWHGVRGLEERKGFINVHFKEIDGDRLQCVVSDDGIGRKRSEELKGTGIRKKSKGIHLVIERLQIINNIKKSSNKIVIEDMDPEKVNCGTLVFIDLPVRKKG